MLDSDWDRIASPFPAKSVAWRIEELTADRRGARLRPYLCRQAIVERLDEVVGREAWSFHYSAIGAGVSCELIIAGASRSSLVEAAFDEGLEQRGEVALAFSAELFGLRPPLSVEESFWVDYDPDERLALLPEGGAVVSAGPRTGLRVGDGPEESGAVPVRAEALRAEALRTEPVQSEPVQAEPVQAEPVRSEPVKPEGQQAIDRLVERLKLEGRGLDAARLLVQHGGYGGDPEAARELYRKLRDLLTKRPESST